MSAHWEKKWYTTFIIANRVNIHYRPHTVLNASRILARLICIPFCNYPDVTILQGRVDLPHNQNMVQMLTLLTLHTYYKNMKNFIKTVTEVSGEGRVGFSCKSKVASESRERRQFQCFYYGQDVGLRMRAPLHGQRDVWFEPSTRARGWKILPFSSACIHKGQETELKEVHIGLPWWSSG